MILWSRQHRIVTDISLSFDKRQKIHLRDVQLQKYQETDKVFLNSAKYEQQTEQAFRFIVLWTVFMYQTPKIDTLRQLQNYSKDDLDGISKQKRLIVTYKNEIVKDQIKMNPKVKTPLNVYLMYKRKEISIFYFYSYMFNNPHSLGRIKEREIERVDFFISYFPKIEEYLQDLDV